jgi:Domain of unknown function (DUF4868)
MVDGEIQARARAVLEQIRAVAREATSASVVVAAGDGANPLADLQSVPLAGSAPQLFLSAARAAANLEIDRLVPFVFGYSPDPHETLVVDLAAYPEIAGPIQRLSQVEVLPLFEGAREFVQRFKGFATVIAPHSQRVVFLRRAGPKKELGRNRSIALLFQNGTFNTVTDRVFLFDEDVDLIATGELAFVLHPSVLQALFPTFTVVAERVAQTLTQLAPLVGNFEDFRRAVDGQLQMRAKLMQIAQRPYLSRLTIDDLKAHIARRGLAVQVAARPDGSEGLVFDPSPAGRWVILKLLDDDYLDSVLTREQYEVNSKARTGSAS